jgi:hypothetical protein
MERASRLLADREDLGAFALQTRALKDLAAAQHTLLRALALVAPEQAFAASRYRLDVLAGAQKRLMEAVAGRNGHWLWWAAEQNRLSRRASYLAETPLFDKSTLEKLSRAAGLMKRAEAGLRADRFDEASLAQCNALEVLLKVSKHMASLSIPRQEGGSAAAAGKPEARGDGESPKSAMGPVRDRGFARMVREPDWNVVLPPRDRHDVRQAMERSMPQAYREHIRRYYLSLAGAGDE